MRTIKRFLIIILATAGLSLAALYVYSPGDFNMRLASIWNYFTIHNKTLLGDLDTEYKDLENFRFAKEKLLEGGPAKDGIPSLDAPIFEPIVDTNFLDDQTIIGVVHNDVAKAYPYAILNWHEIVNDEIAGLPITVTLCPLCDTNPVFIRRIEGVETTFGTSGKLYQSCLIMYDRTTDSLWSQPMGLAIAGPAVNTELEMYPGIKTTIGKWKEQYPDSLIMTDETGYTRDYNVYPYGKYLTNANIYFPVDNQNKLKNHPKELVTYIYSNDPDYTPFNKFSGQSMVFVNKEVKEKGEVDFIWKSAPAKAVWDEKFETVRIYSLGQEIPSSTAFAFVYPAFFEK